MTRWKTVADLSGAVTLLYICVWIYELSNYAAFHIVGLSPGLSMDGVLPTGIAAVAAGGGQVSLVKPIQVALSCAVAGAIYLAARNVDAPIFSLTALASVSLFAASFYWELLSQIGTLSLGLHEAIYTVLSLAGLMAFSRADPKLKRMLW